MPEKKLVDPVLKYKQGRMLAKEAARDLVELQQLDELLYKGMQLSDLPLAPIVEASPNATAADVLAVADKRVEEIYKKITEKYGKVKDSNVKAIYKSYLTDINRKYVDYRTAIISLLEEDVALRKIDLEKGIEELNEKLKEYQEKASELRKIRRDDPS